MKPNNNATRQTSKMNTKSATSNAIVVVVVAMTKICFLLSLLASNVSCLPSSINTRQFQALSLPSLSSPQTILNQQQQQQLLLQQPSTQQLLLQQHDANVYTKSLRLILTDLSSSVQNKSLSFDYYFKNLLSLVKRDLHKMFTDTYGMLYEKNTEIFTEMFDNLAQYYAFGRVQPGPAMESFFARLYQKIFQVLNSQYSFDQKYLKCATEQLLPLKPFGEVPDQLIKEIKRSLIAARTFVIALQTAADVAKNIMSLEQTSECLNLIQNKLLNPTLLGKQQQQQQQDNARTQQLLLPCQHHCELVMLRCIGKTNLDTLDQSWKKFSSSLAELATKLSSNYNIAVAIYPLDVKVSDAIMNFQDNGANITASVFQACGQPNNSPISRLNRAYPASLSMNQENNGGGGSELLAAHSKQLSESSSLDETATVLTDLATQQQQQQQQNQPRHLLSKRELQPQLASSYYQNTMRMNQAQDALSMRAANQNQFAAAASAYGQASDILANVSPFKETTQPPDTQAIVRQFPLLANDIKKYMSVLRLSWTNLPTSVCTSKNTLGQLLSIPATTTTTGTSTSSSTNSDKQQQSSQLAQATRLSTQAQRRLAQQQQQQQQQQQNCYEEKIASYEDNVDIRYKSDINRQASQLATMTAKIDKAIKGEDIDWSHDILSPQSSQPPFAFLPPMPSNPTLIDPPIIQAPPPSSSNSMQPNGEQPTAVDFSGNIEESFEGSGEDPEEPDEEPDPNDPIDQTEQNNNDDNQPSVENPDDDAAAAGQQENKIDQVTDSSQADRLANSTKPQTTPPSTTDKPILSLPVSLMLFFMFLLIFLFLLFAISCYIAPHLFCFNRDKECSKQSTVIS